MTEQLYNDRLLMQCQIDPLETIKELGLTRLQQWFEAVTSRPSVLKTTPVLSEMIRVWGNAIPDWEVPDGLFVQR